jgi:hypothetical protein
MNKSAAQRIIREASPSFLANNPAGITAILQDLSTKLMPVEFRKPFVRLPEEDETYRCFECRGEGDVMGESEREDCLECGGKGEIHFKDNQVILTVWRGGHSIETVATVLPGNAVTAYVNVAQPGFPEWKRLEISEVEANLARSAVHDTKEQQP